MVSIKDVAREAGVSIGTVSNVINNKGNVSPQIRERVYRVIKRLGYVPRVSARNLKLKSSNIIGVIFPIITDGYFSRIYTGLQNYLITKGYSICLTITNEISSIEKTALLQMISQGVAGIVLVSCSPEEDSQAMRIIKEKKIPLVTIDRMINCDCGNFLSFDYHSIGESLCREILLRGYERPVIITGPITYSSEKDFIEGFNDCYHSSGKWFKNLNVFQTCLHKFCSFKLISTYLSDLDGERYPDVIITTSEVLKEGVLEAVEIVKKNKESIDVVSLTEQNWLEMINPRSFGSVFRPAFELGKKAGEILIENIKAVKVFTPKRVILPVDASTFTVSEGKITFSEKLGSVRAAKRNVTLNLYMLKDLSSRAVKSLINDYNGGGGDINIHQFDYDDLYSAIVESRNIPPDSDEFPDIFMVDIPWIPFLADMGYLLDITDILENEEDYLKNYVTGVLELYSKYKGRYFALPFNFSIQLLFYRRDLFENVRLQKMFEDRYGIPLRPPKTWDEYNAIAEFFTRRYNPESPVDYGNTVGGASTTNVEYLPRLWAFGGQVFSKTGEVVLNSYQGLVALRNYVKSYEYAIPNSIDHWWWHQIDSFAKGNVAMMVMYVNHTGNLVDREYSKVVGKFAVATIPGETPALGGWSLSINGKSKKVEESYNFIKWASSSRVAVPFTVLGGCTPRSMIDRAEELLDLYPYLSLAERDFSKSRKRTYALEDLSSFKLKEKEYDSIMSNFLARVVKGEMDYESSLKEVSKTIESKMYES